MFPNCKDYYKAKGIKKKSVGLDEEWTRMGKERESQSPVILIKTSMGNIVEQNLLINSSGIIDHL